MWNDTAFITVVLWSSSSSVVKLIDQGYASYMGRVLKKALLTLLTDFFSRFSTYPHIWYKVPAHSQSAEIVRTACKSEYGIAPTQVV
jgi:hypothetical protein